MTTSTGHQLLSLSREAFSIAQGSQHQLQATPTIIISRDGTIAAEKEPVINREREMPRMTRP